MTEDPKLIKQLEELARFELNCDERKRLAAQLDRIIGYIRRLQDIDTTGVEPVPLVQPTPIDELRADERVECLEREIVMGEAPDSDGRLYRVPSIIER